MIPSKPFPHSRSSSRNHITQRGPWCTAPPIHKNNPNLELKNIMLQFALEVKELGDGQLPLQIRPKEIRCQRRVKASFQGVPCCRTVSVAHAHAGLRSNDALDLKIRGSMLASNPPLGLILVKYQYKVLQAQPCHPLFLFWPEILFKRHKNSKIWLNLGFGFFQSSLKKEEYKLLKINFKTIHPACR